MKKNYNFKTKKHLNILFVCFLTILSYTSIAQNINFTIDTATDNGTSITETIVNGSDTYVLTVFHSGNEELVSLGGGDFIFYLSAVDPLTPHMLTITKNGTPANFNLISIDYDTLEAGTISLTNQNGDFISSPTTYAFGAGTLLITNPSNALDISQININPTDSDDLNDFGFHNINVDVIGSCEPPAATAVFSSQDCTAGNFLVDINVTDLGNGSPSIFDGTTTTPVTTTGLMSFGPYPTGTPINFTLQHGTDVSCDVDLGSIADTCPLPCTPPVGTVTMLSQDCNTEEFNVQLNVTDLGSGGSPAIFDGTTTTPITATGITSYGPYPVGTPVAFTLQHGADPTCDVDLGTISDTCSEIIFTIDTADDNGTSITESIVKDGDTYELTVLHPGLEGLDDLGGGDLVFFHNGTDPLEPFILTITRNGNPTNFTLKGIDYDTLEAGSISILNQDDNEISPNTLYPLGSGAIAITNASNAADISAFKIVPTDSDDLNDFGFHNIKVDVPEPCIAPAATVVISSQDCTQGEFFVALDVTDLGSGGNPVLFDGTTSYPITATGQTDIGPYPTGTPVNFTLQHGEDVACDVDLGTITDTCPPPCESPAGTANLDTPFQDCDAGSFYVVIDITDLGNGSPVLFDGTNSIPITSITQFGIGPYQIGTPVTFTLQHGGDPECDVDLGTIYNLACNDECTDAFVINCGDTVTGSTVHATDNGDNASNDVFYSFTDTIEQLVTLSMCNSDYDSYIRVFDDCPQTNQIAFNDDACGSQSEVTFLASANTMYYIMIEGYSGDNGNYEMEVACTPIPTNDECADAIAVTCGETVTGSTLAATDSGSNASSDVFYSFTDTILQDVTLSLCNSDYDTFVRVFDDCPQTNQIAGNDDSDNCPDNQSELTFTAQPNVTYYIMIEGFGSSDGDFEMSVECIPNVPAPGNDLCTNATPLNLGETLAGETTAGATDDSTSNLDDTTCDSFNFHSDVWYTFQAPVSGQAIITTVITGDSDQANVAVYSSTDCSQLDVDSVGCSSGNGGEVLTIATLVPNATYSIRVWSDGVATAVTKRRAEGTFNITVADATLSTLENDSFQAFSYYPNPVINELVLKAGHTIDKVRVFNLLGQLVISETPNVTSKNINMTQLQTGTYLVEVTIGNATKTIRVIKE